MDEEFIMPMDDVRVVLETEAEFVISELSAAQNMAVADRKPTLDDAMAVADRYIRLFEVVSEHEQKRKDIATKKEERNEDAAQAKRAARMETVKSIGDIALKCGLLFAQGALYVWGVKKTFDFEGFHTASTSIGRNMLNNVSNLFIKK